ncbi:molybdopterin oxidoreductase family protein [Planktothrix sp. FACHB-1365]|uniref:molybdopterin oxidoreductase family protein n=1 Tax=Planktothrix sp. FACHB-1365 TaxID=2692855 RepID=UPI0016862639|nr:nitrate reductase [Planktothrix sp. FACHB-1365]MBD2483060.1 nitrate reductase [Planktothrix sp. FACHB-1365]
MNTIKTLCPFCGVGCGLEIVSTPTSDQDIKRDQHGNPIWKVRGDRQHPSSQGMVCVKGATVTESIRRDRLLHPMIRETLDQPFRQVSWDEALTLIVDQINSVRSQYGSDALCMYGSGQFVTEDYYVAQKLIKGCLGTNNFDANSRLCMSSAVSGYVQSLGADGPPCCYDDLELTDCAFIVGSNTAECHPIVFNRFAKYHKKNPDVKLIVVDPRHTQTAEAADLHLPIRPGTDIDLFNGIGYLLLRWGDIDAVFIDECTRNFQQYAQLLQSYTPEIVAERCGITIEALETAARYWQQSKRILSLWSMGLNQSSEGTAKVRSLINLHLMTGQIGKPGCGPFSLTGQPNAMGGREAGGLAHLLPGYRFVSNPQHRAEVERFWGIPEGRISPAPGRTVWDMIIGLEQDEVQFLWIAATNPAVSLPDLERTKAALLKSPFTVYQEAYYPTETSAYAHVLLPATQWSEKTGVMTNSERRVTYCPGFDQPLGEARHDWEIFAEVGRRLGFKEQFAFQTSADVYAEFVQLTSGRPCDMSGLSHDRLQHQGPTQWPCPAGSTESGRQRLYTDNHFATPDGRAIFGGYHSKGLAEPSDPNYPYVLTTGRLYGHWHTLTRTGRTNKTQQMHPDPFIEIHPKDAANLGIENGDIVEVRSRRGSCQFPAKVTAFIAPGTVFVPMHWGALWASDAEANTLTHPHACPDSRQPELKACAVQLKSVISYQLSVISQEVDS